MVAVFFDIPKEYIPNYHSSWTRIRLEDLADERIYFECHLSYNDKLSFEEEQRKCYMLGLPTTLITRISCDFYAKDIRIEAEKNDIERVEEPYRASLNCKGLDFPRVTMRTFSREK